MSQERKDELMLINKQISKSEEISSHLSLWVGYTGSKGIQNV